MSTNKKLNFKKNLFKLISKNPDLNIDNETVKKTVKKKLETEIVKRLILINDDFYFMIYEDKIKIYTKEYYDNSKEGIDEYLKIIEYPKNKYKKYSKWFHEKYNIIEEIEEGIKKANQIKLKVRILKSIDSNFEYSNNISENFKKELELEDDSELTEAEKILNGDIQVIKSIDFDEDDLDNIKLDESEDEDDLDNIKLDESEDESEDEDNLDNIEEDLGEEEIQELNKEEKDIDKEKIRIAYNRFKYLSTEKLNDFYSIDYKKLSEEEKLSYDNVKNSLKTPEKVDIHINNEELEDDQWT